MRVWVLGLSDIGRSPRLQNHAVSLATQAGCEVDVIGQAGSAPLQALTQNPHIHVHHISSLPYFVSRLPGILRLGIKAVIQAWMLFSMLFLQLTSPDIILVQVPPAIPTLFLSWLVAKCRGAKLIIDWHNFGYTLMALNMGASNPLVIMARWHEKFWGRQADAHLCVSKAMQDHLRQSWGINAIVFYDKAPQNFQPASMKQKHDLFQKLKHDIVTPLHTNDAISKIMGQKEDAIICTETVNGNIQLKKNRPMIVVTSTSWTPDEDFHLLLEAASIYDTKASEAHSLPSLLVFVTGKGPQKESYLKKMRGMVLRKVAFRTLWLASEDYPVLLGSADLGISLHYSSSGFDLPMKVVDMFGCGCPVLSYRYSCIGELVQHGVNGFCFSNARELANQLEKLFSRTSGETVFESLENLRWNVLKEKANDRNTWESCWHETVRPLIDSYKL